MLSGNVVRLQPNKEQESLFFQFAGTNRFAWNKSKDFYDTLFREKGEYATIQQMIEHLQDLKHNNPEYEWLNHIPEAITKQAIKDLKKAYQKAYSDRKKNQKKSKHNKESDYDYCMPNFKKKGKCKESFYQRTDSIHKTDDTHIKITGIAKPVKCTALRGVALPEHIQNPRITFDGKYWYLSYSYEICDEDVITDSDRDNLGIDLGIKDFAITSDGIHYPNINKSSEIKRLRKRLKHIQRQISRKYEANASYDSKGNKIFHKTNNIKKLEQQERLIYRRIRNIQQNFMYSVVNDVLKTKAQNITLEDLNVRGMLQNPKLAKSIQEERLYEFRRTMTYKCERAGINLTIADRFFPSSKLCSCCGYKKTDLKLTDRKWTCPNCGKHHDRDENAAINLENYLSLVW